MISNKLDYMNVMKKTEIKNAVIKEKKELKEATEEFESIFIKMLIDAMDKTIDRKDSLMSGGQGEDVFRGMLNQERSSQMAKNGGIGLSKILYDQLARGLNERDK